ncbi:MAG: ATP-binding cassette domain-containing protein [Candidatus Nanopelagicales bacterium]|jgi:ATPase subunit of ABC transporter with duplicated ATPase domains|nr:ATP-binding cassette domain-containing protein [Candidatus Nanopelagicales bacterium]
MPTTVTLAHLTVSFGARELIRDLDTVIGPGEVVGLIGPNGCGKSTLLRTIAGLHAADSGSVIWSPPGARIGYLPQERAHSGTVGEHLIRITGVHEADDRVQRAAEGLGQGTPGADADYSAALEDWLALGGADLDARIEATLAHVAPGLAPGHPMQGLSGGQSARVGLAGLLLSRFDAYLLDEPTNDLDLDGLELVEQFLAGVRGPVVLVSHDREFLARRITRVLDFDPALEVVGDYRGGFDAYVAERSRARDRAQADFDTVTATRADLMAQMRAARATSDRGAKVARAKHRSGSIDKMLRDAMIDGATAGASSAGRLQRQIERLPDVVEPRREWQLRLRVADVERSGDVVATLRSATARRGDFRIGPLDLQVDRGDCVVITGANGSGKTTLLGMLLGDVPLESGHRSLGARVVVGRVDQSRVPADPAATLRDLMTSELPGMPEAEVRALLAKFGLGADRRDVRVGRLSPGERTRIGLAVLGARGANVLVMDEPTNHLDLPAIEQVEAALDQFEGTILLVSHDRRLIDHVARQARQLRRLAVRDGGVTELH